MDHVAFGNRIVKTVFVITTVFFGLKVATHISAFFQGTPWAAWLLEKSLSLPPILDPFNLPVLGGVLGLVSLTVYCRAHTRGIDLGVPCYQLVLPFVYLLVWQIVMVVAWGLST
jgi:hypothetical protein